jgi:hypothetical protein
VRGERTLTLPAVEGLCQALGLALVAVNGAPAEQPAPKRSRGKPGKAPAAAQEGTRGGGADHKTKGTKKGRRKP